MMKKFIERIILTEEQWLALELPHDKAYYIFDKLKNRTLVFLCKSKFG